VFGRQNRLPAGHRPDLARDERVVAWAAAGDGTVVVTTAGVWLPGRAERLGWHQIHKATWSGSSLTVVPAVEVASGEGYLVMADAPALVVGMPDPGDVPQEVRKRVTRSVAHTSHYAVQGGGVRVVARRVAGIDGVTWHVRYDDGTDATDPEVVAATAELVAAAAATTSPPD
jgi:hypothetical protein